MKISEYIRWHGALDGDSSRFSAPRNAEPLLRAIGRGKRVLMLGCSDGELAKRVQERKNEVYGVDLDPKAVELATLRGIPAKVLDLNEGIPFENSFFDVVSVGGLVGQVYDTRKLFEDVYRALVPGGILVLAVPNLNSLDNRLRVLTGAYLSSVGVFPEDQAGRQIRVFNLSKLREICATTGFDIERIRGVASRDAGLGSRVLLQPLLRARPQLADLLIVRARRRAVRRRQRAH